MSIARCCLCGSTKNLAPPDEHGEVACRPCYDRSIASADRALGALRQAKARRELPPIRTAVVPKPN